ncbi:MAG: lytic transglycosylase domain-containing protein [Candidatus Omnitrophota bacterium]
MKKLICVVVAVVAPISFYATNVLSDISCENFKKEKHIQIMQDVKKASEEQVEAYKAEQLVIKEKNQIAAKHQPLLETIDRRYGHRIKEIAKKTRCPERIIKAVIAVESGNNPNAKSKREAYGLMQVQKRTALDVGVKASLYHPWWNIYAGSKYLMKLKKRFSTWELALAAYNAGPDAIDRAGGVPNFPETKKYLVKLSSLTGEF